LRIEPARNGLVWRAIIILCGRLYRRPAAAREREVLPAEVDVIVLEAEADVMRDLALETDARRPAIGAPVARERAAERRDLHVDIGGGVAALHVEQPVAPSVAD